MCFGLFRPLFRPKRIGRNRNVSAFGRSLESQNHSEVRTGFCSFCCRRCHRNRSEQRSSKNRGRYSRFIVPYCSYEEWFVTGESGPKFNSKKSFPEFMPNILSWKGHLYELVFFTLFCTNSGTNWGTHGFFAVELLTWRVATSSRTSSSARHSCSSQLQAAGLPSIVVNQWVLSDSRFIS